MALMPIEHIEDWEMRIARQDAFWHNEIIDRPVVIMTLPKDNPDYPWPKAPNYASVRDRWMDSQYIAESTVAGSMRTDYLGDALPMVMPNIGPEVFSAFFDCEMEYSKDTSWSIPNLLDWNDVDKIRFNEDNFYWKKINEMTDTLLEAGKGKFYTGITDLHPGGDALVAFRDPQELNIDLIEHPEEVKKLLEYVNETYFEVFDFFYNKLKDADQAITSWPGIVSSKKWYVPSNDFSCMISKQMFDEFFLPGIAAECRHMEANVYHLDGPDALRHLDSLLSIPELNAIQWVFGAGHGRASDWIPVYKKCQAAGKGLQINMYPDEVDTFMDNLRPEGLWIGIWGVTDRDQADMLLKKISNWK